MTITTAATSFINIGERTNVTGSAKTERTFSPPPCGEGGAKRRVGGAHRRPVFGWTPTPNPSPQGGGGSVAAVARLESKNK